MRIEGEEGRGGKRDGRWWEQKKYSRKKQGRLTLVMRVMQPRHVAD